MMKGWQTKTLDQISTNLDSRRVPITKGARASGEYPYYGASGIVDYVDDFIFNDDTLLISEDGANLLARSSPIAFPASGKYWVNNHAHIIKFENLTTQRFVELYLESIPLDEYVTGAAQPKLTQKALNSIPIPIPPFPEQQRIVGILDEALEGLATTRINVEKNLQNCSALFESQLQFLFTHTRDGWTEKAFEACIEDVKYTRKIQRKDFLEEGTFPVISQESAFINGYWNNAGDVFKITRPAIIFGDHTQIFKFVEFDFVLGADGVKILLPRRFLDPQFFYYSLRSAPLKTLGYARHYRLLKNIQISYPDLSEQIEIGRTLGKLEVETKALATLYSRKLDELEALKESLLREAFTGQLAAATV